MSQLSFSQKLKRKLAKRLFKAPFPWKARAEISHSLSYCAAIAQSREADGLQLVHAPALSKKSVYIFSIPLGVLLGELDGRTAKKLLALFGEGFCLDGEIYQIDEREGHPLLTVLIYDSAELLKGEILPMILE